MKFVYEQIRQHGVVHRGDIGADVQNINFVLATALKLPRPWGVIVADVRAGSQAEKAGLKPFDAILSMDGKRIVSFPQFDTALYFKRAGEQITLEIARQGATMTIRVPVGDRSSIPDAEAMLGADPEKSLIPRLGIIGKDVNREMAAKDPGVRDFSGVIVLGTTPDLQDLDCDLIVGDIIHSVNGQPIPDIVSLRKIMQTFKSGDAIALRIERRHRFMYIAFETE